MAKINTISARKTAPGRKAKAAREPLAAGPSKITAASAESCTGTPLCFYEANPESLCKENNAGYLIRHAYVSLSRMIDQGVMPLDLTAMQWRPLVLIRYSNVNTSAELSRITDVDTGAMTRTLDRLEAKGFLTRRRSEKDRRVVKLALTDSGRQAAEATLPIVAQTLNRHLGGFSTREINQLIGFLQRIISNGSDRPDASTAAAH